MYCLRISCRMRDAVSWGYMPHAGCRGVRIPRRVVRRRSSRPALPHDRHGRSPCHVSHRSAHRRPSPRHSCRATTRSLRARHRRRRARSSLTAMPALPAHRSFSQTSRRPARLPAGAVPARWMTCAGDPHRAAARCAHEPSLPVRTARTANPVGSAPAEESRPPWGNVDESSI